MQPFLSNELTCSIQGETSWYMMFADIVLIDQTKEGLGARLIEVARRKWLAYW